MFTTVLMIEKPLDARDVETVTTLHGEEPVSFVVLMQPRGDQDEFLRALDDVALGHLEEVAEDARQPHGREALRTAEEGVETTLRSLREAGSEATGQVVEKNPLAVLRDVVDRHGADEVVVITEPHLVEEFFHHDWASRARHNVGVPVLKLYADVG